MERERLNHLMQSPSAVAKEDLAGLQELTARYPWFSAAHLLLAVGEHAAGEVLYDERARTAAAHLPSRSVLFDLVHAPAPVAPVPAVPPPAWAMPPEVAPPPIVETLPQEALPSVAPVLTPPVEPLPEAAAPAWVPEAEPVPSPTDLTEANVGHPAPDVPAPVETTVPEPPPVEATAPAPPAPEEDPLDALIRRSAFAGSYELLLEHEEVAKPAEPIAPAPPTPTLSERPSKRRFTDWLEAAEPFSAVPVAPSGPAASDWLRQATEAPATAAAPDQTPVPPPVPAPMPADTPEPPAKSKAGMSVSEAASLIDRFIRQETPEPPKRAAFFNPQTAAKRSLEDHAELVTETLAQIYAKQGNIAKAKAAYRRLAEKHPERREHFLALAKGLDAAGKA